MHNHQCRYCQNRFVCGDDAAECFRKYIVCDCCFWRYETRYFLLVCLLLLIALGATLLVSESLTATIPK